MKKLDWLNYQPDTVKYGMYTVNLNIPEIFHYETMYPDTFYRSVAVPQPSQ